MGMSALEVRRRVMLAQPHEAVASGAVASFRTDVVSALPMEFDLNPIQDLHGQANPYPPGGGKNVLDLEAYISSVTQNYSVDSDGWITIDSMGSGQTSFYAVHWPIGPITNGSVIILIDSSRTTAVNICARIYSNGSAIAQTEAGNPQSSKIQNRSFDEIGFNWSANGKATVKIAVVKESTISEWTPYSNICPITGHDGFTRTGTGVNVWDEQWEVGTISTSTGMDATSNANIRSKNYIPVITGQKYYCKFASAGYIFRYDENKNHISNSYFSASFETTIGENVKYLRFFCGTGYGTTYKNDISINYPSTDHNYHAYTGTSYTTIFPDPPETVYGGHIRDNGNGTGTLVVDRAYVDLGTLTWNYSASGNPFFYASIDDIKRPDSWNAIPNWLCSRYKTVSGNSASGGVIGIGGNPNNSQVRICDTAYTDKDTFATAMSGVQLVYELATPTEYTLSLTALQSLIGQNHVWVDNADSVSVEYWGH